MATNKGETKKKGFDWLKLKRGQLNQKPRGKLVFLTAILEIEVLYFLWRYGLPTLKEDPFWADVLKGSGVWTFLALLLSAPIAFFLWQFRDQNTVHQIENQRKDVNLKEFHKIAEWVSGLHLVEDKIIEKTKPSEQPNNETADAESEQTLSEIPLTIENAREYGQAGAKRHLPSHSREDGAVGLQVAAVYMLRPFYCGEHGDYFRKPALNLLTAAWLALFKQVEGGENQARVKELSTSPLAIALTEVLLADVGEHLRYHKEVFPNLYLPYLDLHLPGLTEDVLSVFQGMNCSGIQLYGANLESANLVGANLVGAHLEEAYLEGAHLVGAHLVGAYLVGAYLVGAYLERAHLVEADLEKADLGEANLGEANLGGAHLKGAHLKRAHLKGADLERAHLERAHLEGAYFGGAYFGGAHLEGANLGGANLLDIELLYESNGFDKVKSWQGALLREATIKELGFDDDKRNSMKWIVAPALLESESGSKKDLLVEILCCFYHKSSDYRIEHRIQINEEPDKFLEKLHKLNPDWEITIIDPEEYFSFLNHQFQSFTQSS